MSSLFLFVASLAYEEYCRISTWSYTYGLFGPTHKSVKPCDTNNRDRKRKRGMIYVES